MMRPVFLVAGLAAVGAVLLSTKSSATSSVVPARDGYVPARDMTPEQAKAELDRLARLGQVRILGWEGTHVTLDGHIGDVEYRYVNAPRIANHLDVRLAVLLARLAGYLNSAFGVHVVHHLGIYPGNPAHPNDCHNDGRAIDISGFTTRDADLSVARDWGAKPYRGRGYRLLPSDPGFALFLATYDFLAREATDTSFVAGRNGLPSEVGATPPPHYILSPDHSDPAIRSAHHDHIHAQIGPT